MNIEYFKKYDISDEQIEEIKDRYNDGIISFLNLEREFIGEKLDYLKEKDYKIFPILENNIKIFLEEIYPLQNKMKKMEKSGYSNKAIQMILMNEQLYDKM